MELITNKEELKRALKSLKVGESLVCTYGITNKMMNDTGFKFTLDLKAFEKCIVVRRIEGERKKRKKRVESIQVDKERKRRIEAILNRLQIGESVTLYEDDELRMVKKKKVFKQNFVCEGLKITKRPL